MRRPRNIYNLRLVVLAGLALFFSAGCGGIRPAGSSEKSDQDRSGIDDPRGFDPLELPRDTEIVPERYPRAGSIVGTNQLIDTTAAVYAGDPDSLSQTGQVMPPSADTVSNQAYRVQLVTSNVYGEAKAAATVAEEIFDQPVYLDYEVPNYKVRVGSFAHRDDADQYRQKARTAGYSNAWVVMVNLKVRKLAPLYDDLPLIGPPVPVDSTQEYYDSLDVDGDN